MNKKQIIGLSCLIAGLLLGWYLTTVLGEFLKYAFIIAFGALAFGFGLNNVVGWFDKVKDAVK